MPDESTAVAPLSCSFCSKTQNEVIALVAAQDAFICDECTELSAELVGQELCARSRRDAREQAEATAYLEAALMLAEEFGNG